MRFCEHKSFKPVPIRYAKSTDIIRRIRFSFKLSDSIDDNYTSAEYCAGLLVPGQTPATAQELIVYFD
jgi:hypothetical protein